MPDASELRKTETMLSFLYMCRQHLIEVRSIKLFTTLIIHKHEQKVDEILQEVEKLKKHTEIVESDIKHCEVIHNYNTMVS